MIDTIAVIEILANVITILVGLITISQYFKNK